MKKFPYPDLRVLVVDDNGFTRKLIRNMLRQIAPLQVLEADNGQAAMAVIADQRVDLVLLDWYMPKGNGDQVLKSMAKAGLMDIPVIVVTSAARRNLVVEAVRLGVAGIIGKPFSISVLAGKIESIMRARSELADRHQSLPDTALDNQDRGDVSEDHEDEAIFL